MLELQKGIMLQKTDFDYIEEIRSMDLSDLNECFPKKLQKLSICFKKDRLLLEK